MQERRQARTTSLSETEYEVLLDIAIGLTDHAIAGRRHISLRSVQGRLQQLYVKLGLDERPQPGSAPAVYNSRGRAVALALIRRIINGRMRSSPPARRYCPRRCAASPRHRRRAARPSLALSAAHRPRNLGRPHLAGADRVEDRGGDIAGLAGQVGILLESRPRQPFLGDSAARPAPS